MPHASTALRHIAANRQTRDAWERCAGHRRRIHELISSAAPAPGGRICVLGAGNCNDLDLRALQCDFAEIHFADLDREALDAAVARQCPSNARLFLHAPCDLDAPALDLDGPFDLVLSAGVLTQMFQTIEDLGLPPETEVASVLAVRTRHLRLLFRLVRPGGAFVLVTDVVSTATAPDLDQSAEAELPDRIGQLIAERNFFTGANPAAIWKELNEAAEFYGLCRSMESHDPWLWPVTSTHHYLTWAVTVRTRD
jgi:hypothetical protein